MILAWLLLLTGLVISGVAIYYSVVGLAAIFSAAVIPIYIMGSSLEVAKLVCASWLKANWERAPRFMKYYMISAVVVLMLITSMGIFGFLSKAHNDQNLVSGDVQSKIAIYDEKIKTEKDNVDAAKKALVQMDAQVDQMLGRTDTDKGAERAVAIRKQQAKERANLQADINKAHKEIAKLQAERAPIAAEVRKVEAEVGPIKYIAKFIYGDHGADENMLEKAVTWIIILIVIVFDPLAVIMLLAAQMTFGWAKEQKEKEDTVEDDETPPEALVKLFQEGLNRTDEPDAIERAELEPKQEAETTGTLFPKVEPSNHAIWEDALSPNKEEHEETPIPLDQWNAMIAEAEKAVEEEKLKDSVAKGDTYIDSEGNAITVEETPAATQTDDDELKKKNYMIKTESGEIQIKEKDMSKIKNNPTAQSGVE